MIKKLSNLEDTAIISQGFNKLVSDLFENFSSTISLYKSIEYRKLAEKRKIEILFFFDTITKKIGVFSEYRDSYSDTDFESQNSTLNFGDLLIIRPGLFISTTKVYNFPFDVGLEIKFDNGKFYPNSDFNFYTRNAKAIVGDGGPQHYCWKYNKLTSEDELKDFLAEKILTEIIAFDLAASKYLVSDDHLYNSLFGEEAILSGCFNYSRALYYFNEVKDDPCGRSNAIKMLNRYCLSNHKKEDLTDPEDITCQVVFSASNVEDYEYSGMFAKIPKFTQLNFYFSDYDYDRQSGAIVKFLQSYFIELLKTSNTQLSTVSSKMLDKAERIIKERNNLPIYCGRLNYFGFVKIEMKTLSYFLKQKQHPWYYDFL